MNDWVFNEAQLREALADQVEALVVLGVSADEAHGRAATITEFLHAAPVSDRRMLVMALARSAARKRRNRDIKPRRGAAP